MACELLREVSGEGAAKAEAAGALSDLETAAETADEMSRRMSLICGMWGRPSPFFLSTKNIHTHVHTTLSATSICGANVCKWALCTTTSF
jgi:hypothetical protein